MPIKKGDISRMETVSWSKVAEHLLDLTNSVDALLATIQGRFERNDLNVGLFNLGFRAINELRRVARDVEGPIEELAWSVRNLHEIDLTLRYVLQSQENLAEWTDQMLTDEKDVVEGFLTLGDQFAAEDRLRLEERLRRIHDAARRLDAKMRRPWAMRHLAQATNREKEYETFYKFLSKFVHPSSWIVNGRSERTGATEYRNLILGLAQVLARRIYGLLYDHCGLEEQDVVEGTHSVRWQAPPE
jgi:hypothetical protein